MIGGDNMPTITRCAEAALIEQEEYISPAASLKYLNEPQNFQSFAKYMQRLIKNSDIKIEPENLGGYLSEIVLALEPVSTRDKEIIERFFSQDFTADAQINWPKEHSDRRKIAMKLCFALNLGLDESKDFLQKVCNIYGFNVRDEYEAICLYCKCTGQDYSTVQNLLNQYENASQDFVAPEHPHQTRAMWYELSNPSWESNEQFLNTFLIPNKPNFTKNSRTIAQKYKELRCYLCEQIIQWNLASYEGRNDIEKAESDELFDSVKKQIKKLAAEDSDFSDYAAEFSDITKAKDVLPKIETLLRAKYPNVVPDSNLELTQGIVRYYDLLNDSISSYQLMYHTLWGIPFVYQATDTKTISRQGKLVRITKSKLDICSLTDYFPSRFPHRFPDQSPYLTARKTIILLDFLNEFFDMLCDVLSSKFKYFKDSYKDPDKDPDKDLNLRLYERFYTGLNRTLKECNMHPLYPADPFDWLILKSVRAFSQINNGDVDPIEYFNEVLRLSFPDYSVDFEKETSKKSDLPI